MKKLATDGWWAFCLVLLGLANVMLFIYMMLMMGFIGGPAGYPLFYIFMWAFMFSYYCAAPLGIFGLICAMGFSMAKQVERAALLAALSGGALFSAIMVWAFFHL